MEALILKNLTLLAPATALLVIALATATIALWRKLNQERAERDRESKALIAKLWEVSGQNSTMRGLLSQPPTTSSKKVGES